MNSVLIAVVCLLYIAHHSESAPSSRRSRATSFADSSDAPRENKLTSMFKEDPTQNEETTTPQPSNRQNKALNFLGFYPSFLSSGLDYGEDDDDVTFAVNDDNIEEEDLSRTIPTRRRPQNKNKNNQNTNNNNNNYINDNINSLQYDNSPIFYIRLPPTPYMFVPGLGYVSQPPSLGPPMAPPAPVDPFINVPIDFVSNGKPTNVYQWPGAPNFPPQVDPFGYGAPAPAPLAPAYRPQMEPGYPAYSKPQRKPVPNNSKVTNLKGPYVFNGKPNDNVFVLRDSYNSLYSDALQNFYP